ncbi:MAG: CvpA family protein [Saprospiraceae bacterium]
MAIDIMCAMMGLYGFYLGYTRGIIKTVFTVLSIFFGIVAAAKFGPAMTDFLQSAFNYHNPLMFIAGLMLAFILTMVLIRMLANGLEGLLETANINFINQVLGGAVLSGLLIAVFSLLVMFGDKAHIINKQTKSDSKTYVFLEPMPEKLMQAGSVLKPVFTDFWNYSVDFMDRLERMNVERTENNNIFDIEDDEDSGNRDYR